MSYERSKKVIGRRQSSCERSVLALGAIACLILGASFQSRAAEVSGLVAEFRFNAETRNWAAPAEAIEAETIEFTTDRFGTADRAALFPVSGFVGSMERDYVRNRNQWTWAGWILPSNLTLDNRIIYSENQDGNVFDIRLDRDRIVVATWNEEVPAFWTGATASSPVVLNEWQHVAVTLEAPDGQLGTCRIYLDGELTFLGDLPVVKVSSPSPAAFAIGQNIGALTTGQPEQKFVGGIDDIMIYSRALTAAEIPGTMEPNKRLALFTAVELEFFAEQGMQYQLQWSEDLVTWNDEGPATMGEDQPVSIFASTRINRKRFWRFQELN